MNANEYPFESDGLYFKHQISVNLPCDAYSMHTHNIYELLYFVNGDATQIIEDQKYKLRKGDLILIRPLKYHFIQIDSPSDYERYDILFDDRLLNIESISLISADICIINLDSVPLAKDLFPKLSYYYAHFEASVFIKLASALLNELFYLLSITPEHLQTDSLSLMSPTLSQAIQYINENLCSLSGVKEVAQKCFVSESYLFRLFDKELHQTPKKYINNKRLLMAQRLINSGEKPTSVYGRCGFQDYTTFYRNYTSFFGHSPSQEKIRKT